MTLILSTAPGAALLSHLDSVVTCGCVFRAVADGGGGARCSFTISSRGVSVLAMIVSLPSLFLSLSLCEAVVSLLLFLFLSLSAKRDAVNKDCAWIRGRRRSFTQAPSSSSSSLSLPSRFVLSLPFPCLPCRGVAGSRVRRRLPPPLAVGFAGKMREMRERSRVRYL